MAILLVRVAGTTHRNPLVEERECWHAGDVVWAYPDGHSLGRKEGPPKFRIVRIDGMSAEEARESFCRPVMDSEGRVMRKARHRYETGTDSLIDKETSAATRVSSLRR